MRAWTRQEGVGHEEEPVAFEVVVKGRDFQATSDELGVGSFAGLRYRFHGQIQAGRAAVGWQEGWWPGMKPLSGVAGLNEGKAAQGGLEHFAVAVVVPPGCEPAIEPATPVKQMMLEGIVRSFEREVAGGWSTCGKSGQLPTELSVVVTDFNDDFPSTWAVLEPCGELYEVVLHDPTAPWDEESIRKGELKLAYGIPIDQLPDNGDEPCTICITPQLLERISKHTIRLPLHGGPRTP